MAQTDVKYEIKIMNVPFNNTYKDVVYFSSKSARDTTFSRKAEYEYENLNIIVKNKAFILRGRWDAFNKCNYMMYRYTTNYSNGHHTSDWFYSFITDVSYDSRLGTIINHTTDVWQTYHTTADFTKKTLIERGHVWISQDNYTRWLAPEPFSTPSTEEKEIRIPTGNEDEDRQAFKFDFTPIIIAETISNVPLIQTNSTLYDVGYSLASATTAVYEYGGVGGNNNINASEVSGTYRCTITNRHRFFELYTLPEQITGLNNISIPSYNSQSHLTDIIAIKAFPIFASVGTRQPIWDITGDSCATLWTSVELADDTDTVDVDMTSNNAKLACGYKPHNKKMFSSLANAYKIYNFNGLSIPIRPELLEEEHVKVRANMSNYGDSLKLHLQDYKNTKVFFDIPYTYSFQFGYNANTGNLQGQQQSSLLLDWLNAEAHRHINIGTAAVDVAIGSGEMAGGLSMMDDSGNYSGSRADMMFYKGVGALSNGVEKSTKSFIGIGSSEINYKNDMFNYNTNYANAYSSISFSMGTMSGDRTSLSAKYWALRLAQCSPLKDECEQIDAFLDRYGYAINELISPSYFMFGSTDRPYWSYIKTKGSQIKIDAPNNDNVIFNEILNGGTTVWKDISKVGNYSLNNWTISE